MIDQFKKAAKSMMPSLYEALWRQRQRMRGWIYDHMYDGSVITRRGFRYRLHKCDVTSRNVYVMGLSCPAEISILKSVLSSVNSFIDCGAHIGTFAIPIGQAFSGSTLAIEPVESNFNLLQENIRLNQLSSKIEAVQLAVGDCAGKQVIHLSELDRGKHRFGGSEAMSSGQEEVEVGRLDFLVENRPDLAPPYLIKLDVEGAEYQALTGFGELLMEPCLIFCEFWPHALESTGPGVAALDDLRLSRGLAAFEVPLHISCLKPLTSLSELAARLPDDESYCDVILTNMTVREIELNRWLVD